MPKELKYFRDYASDLGLNSSLKRDVVLQAFFRTRGHVSADDLHRLVRKAHPRIGYTTVYRTLKLIARSGLAKVVDFEDGVKRYERRSGREFHAHCICSRCGRSVEVFHEQIRDLTERLARDQRFTLHDQRLEIFGVCRACRERSARKVPVSETKAAKEREIP